MAFVRLELLGETPLVCPRCAGRLRRALQRVKGIEEIHISVRWQSISIGYNRVLVDDDRPGELLAHLGYVARPAAPRVIPGRRGFR
jgi:hypothetical protein